ncbi:MAG: alpha/beta hydrolase family esterase [Steroidobacteraceae bacterium]
MLRLLRQWLKRAAGSSATARTLQRGRSRFLAARFKDSNLSGTAERHRRRELDYRLYLPSGSSARDTLPLIVMLHGCKQDALAFAEGTRMNTLAEESRFAVLYPEQSTRANPLRCWNWFEPASLAGEGEAALIARLIVQVTERRPIDPRRVYLVGMSAGGAMACLLAVRHSRLFAACATHSGVMYGAAHSPLQALAAMRSGPTAAAMEESRRSVRECGDSGVMVPTLVIHGDHDPTVNPVNAQDIIEQLKFRAECLDSAAGALLASEELSSGAGRSYRQQDYTRQGRIVLRSILVEGLGHAWSGGDDRHEFNDPQGPDASRLILDFAARFKCEAAAPPLERRSALS